MFLLGGIDTWNVACYAMGVIEDVHKLVLRWVGRACTELQDNLSVYLVYEWNETMINPSLGSGGN